MDTDCIRPCCRADGPFRQALECSVDEKSQGFLVGFECYKRVNALESTVVRSDFLVKVQGALGIFLFEDRDTGIIAGSLDSEGEQRSTFIITSRQEKSCTPNESEWRSHQGE